MPPQIGTGLQPGEIQLYDNYVPSLAGGEYNVTVTPSVTGIDTQNWFQNITQDFEVRAPQFTLDPVDVGECFPPNGSNGSYGADLPFVVLNQRAIPWEREIVSDRTIPWVALLTLQSDEITLHPITNEAIRTSTVTEFLTADPDGKIQKPAIDPQYVPADVLQSTMLSIVIPSNIFTAIVPRQDELASLTHVRATDTGDQAESDAIEDGWYSVVFSNRFPDSRIAPDASGSKNYVCLVSLEGYSQILPGNGSPSMDFVQLAVLYTTNFVSNPAAEESFSDLMENFVTQEAGNPNNLLPRIPVSGASSAALTRINQGYTALRYHTITGEETFAWFRGPFPPVVPQPLPAPDNGSHYLTSSEVVIYQQSEGIFDLSYCDAFQIGRAVALADRAFSIAMLNQRRMLANQLQTMGERLETGRYNDLSPRELVQPGLERKYLTNAFNSGAAESLRTTMLAMNAETATKQAPVKMTKRDAAARANPAERTRALLAREDVQAFIGEQATSTSETDYVIQFLTNLALLANVPFTHLMPDQRMLPVESIRFFYIDQYWIESLIDGALSLGTDSSRTVAITAAIRQPLRLAVNKRVGTMRAKQRKLTRLAVDTSGPDFPVKSGILIRSAVVAGWPGLVCRADNGATHILRMERLSKNTMIILFDAIPQTVWFSEPWHGLRFGVRGTEPVDDVIQLRTSVGAPMNQTWPASGGFSQYFRTQSGVGQRVMDVQRILPALGSAVGFTLHPATFATEMVQSPQRLSFVPA